MYDEKPQYYAPPPAYGQPPPPPGYYEQPLPSPGQYGGYQQGPTVIRIDNNHDEGDMCPNCGRGTPSYPKRTIGAAAIITCILATALCGIIGIFVLFMDGFMDTEMICSRCRTVKQTIPANIC